MNWLWKDLKKSSCQGKDKMESNFKVLWTKTAQNDLDEIIEYIAIDSIDRALAIFAKIKEACETLNLYPSRCRIVPELLDIDIRSYRELIVKPYRIVIRIQGNYVYIIGVFDIRRDLESILINRIVR